MQIAKGVKVAGLGAAIVVGSMLAVTAAGAQIGGGSEEERQERIAEFAERFELDEAEVQAYFDEKKAERQAEREEARAEHLAGLVEDGVLTQEQADELSALRDEIKAEVEALKESGAEREDIKAEVEELKEQVEAWAEEEGLDLEDLRPERGERFGKRGFGSRL